MIVLGIETSCDETAVGIVANCRKLLSHQVSSQIELHNPYGGVVPEIAARNHLETVIPICQQALTEAQLQWSDIDAIGVTYGAGLAGSLMIGTVFAQVLALVKDKPLYGCNHVEGHVYANFITDSNVANVQTVSRLPKFPLLALIVSGKHSQLVLFDDHFNYRLLGQAIDDAVGEAFDKVARLLGLGYPGGPAISRLATKGNPNAFLFPKAQTRGEFDFSFSGLKTAVLRQSQQLLGADHNLSSWQIADQLNDNQSADLAASFQVAAVGALVDKTVAAFWQNRPRSVVIAGGVGANRLLRSQLKEALPITIEYADPGLCTDNGSMIACLASYQALKGRGLVQPTQLEIKPALMM